MKRLEAAAALAALIALGGAAPADDAAKMVLVPDAAAVHWSPSPASLPHSTQISILSGDPAKPGPFVLRLMAPPNTVIAPHTHATPESVTILSGMIYHEMGDKIDRAQGKKLEAGGFVFLPANMPHALWTTDQPVVLEVTGTGPFGLHYINPADDPSRS